MKFHSDLHLTSYYKSIVQNIEEQGLPPYFVLRLGGKEPYLKFGELDGFDVKIFHRTNDRPEEIFWVDLVEPGKLVLPLRHVRFIYRNRKNIITHWEFAFEHCIHHGCRAIFDSKAYFIYGPENQLQVNNLSS